jgi:Cu(I)/Ag(I) efflux system membrane protein CusA/SilA
MVENAHRKMEVWQKEHPGEEIEGEARWRLIGEASVEVGPALFSSLLIVTVSFIPVFALQAQEGRLFSPLAFTKTYAMAAAAGLAVTLVPVLMGYFIRGKIPAEENPSTGSHAVYRPLLSRGAPLGEDDGGDRAGRPTPGLPRSWRQLRPRSTRRPALHASALPGLRRQAPEFAADRPPGSRACRKCLAGRPAARDGPGAPEMFETTIQLNPRPVAAGHVDGEAHRGARPHGEGAGLANIWCCPSATARHARHRHQEPAGIMSGESFVRLSDRERHRAGGEGHPA